MVEVLDSTYVGKAIGTFKCIAEKDLWGRDYKQSGLTMEWFINNKIKDVPTVSVRDNHFHDLSIVVSLDSPVWYDSEMSCYDSNTDDKTTTVTFKCEFTNADVEEWKRGDIAKSYVGACYTSGNKICHIESLSEYQVDYPNYRFNVTEVDTTNNTITKRFVIFDFFELSCGTIDAPKDDFVQAVKDVCSKLCSDI